MKTNFKMGTINVTIQDADVPVNIVLDGIEVSTEASPSEYIEACKVLPTIMNSFKDLFKPASTPMGFGVMMGSAPRGASMPEDFFMKKDAPKTETDK